MSINANMSILDGMRKIIPEESIFITVGNTSFNMSKTAYELLGNPTGLEIYIGSGKVALKPGNDFKFTRHKTGTMYRINGKMISEDGRRPCDAKLSSAGRRWRKKPLNTICQKKRRFSQWKSV